MVAPVTQLAAVLACPQCRTPMSDLHCGACDQAYPSVDAAPALYPAPALALADWQNRFDCALAEIEHELARARAAMDEVADPTHARLTRLIAGLECQRRCLEDALPALRGTRVQAPSALAVHIALRTRAPDALTALGYLANVFRDWCWGDYENGVNLQSVQAALRGTRPNRILILGAGAGRLAWDVHQTGDHPMTCALELNPFLGTLAARMARGDQLSLVEFPPAPVNIDHVAVTRQLRAPTATRPGFCPVLGDALSAPFQDGSFDVLITPWFTDIVDAPITDVLGQYNRVLAPNGVWIQHGSLVFQRQDPVDRLTDDEVTAVAARSGFEMELRRDQRAPYLWNDSSRMRREELMTTIRYRKVRESHGISTRPTRPQFLLDDRTPVPLLDAFQSQAAATRVHAEIMALIDGRTSVAQMAQQLEQRGWLPRDQAAAALRRFLETMWKEATAHPPLR